MTMAFAPFLDLLRTCWADHEESDREPRNLIVLRRVDSTQNVCRRLHQDYEKEESEVPPVAVVAYEQMDGLGRHGRSWESPGGRGVYASLIRPVASAKNLRQVPIAVAVALVGVLDTVLDRPCGLRWPNDLMVDGFKLGGILVDAVTRGTGGSLALIGFGVNHCGTPVPGVSACVVENCADPPSLAALVDRLTRSVDAHLKQLDDDEDLLRRYAASSIHKPGEEIRCRVGNQVKVGMFRGFAAGGFLRLETPNGIELLTAGTLELPKENA